MGWTASGSANRCPWSHATKNARRPSAVSWIAKSSSVFEAVDERILRCCTQFPALWHEFVLLLSICRVSPEKFCCRVGQTADQAHVQGSFVVCRRTQSSCENARDRLVGYLCMRRVVLSPLEARKSSCSKQRLKGCYSTTNGTFRIVSQNFVLSSRFSEMEQC